MISELPIEEDEHGGCCSLIRCEISDAEQCKKHCKEININDLPDDMNRGPARYKAGFLSTSLKYCGVTKGPIGIEIGYCRICTLFPHYNMSLKQNWLLQQATKCKRSFLSQYFSTRWTGQVKLHSVPLAPLADLELNPNEINKINVRDVFSFKNWDVGKYSRY